MSGRSGLELLLVNPGSRAKTYQELGEELTAVEPPLWCRLIAGYVRDRGHSVAIIDAEAEDLEPAAVAARVAEARPRLVAMVAFGHQPSASTQQMAAAGPACRAIKEATPPKPSSSSAAMLQRFQSARCARKRSISPATAKARSRCSELLDVLRGGKPHDFSKVQGLVWSRGWCRPHQPLGSRSSRSSTRTSTAMSGTCCRWRNTGRTIGSASAILPPASPTRRSIPRSAAPTNATSAASMHPSAPTATACARRQAVAAEIDLLHANYGVKTYKIVDEMFVLNERHVLGLCDRPDRAQLRPEHLGLCAGRHGQAPHAREAAPGGRALARARHRVRQRARARRGREVLLGGRHHRIVRQIQAAGINVIGNFIFGLPDDDLETMQQTLALAQELNCEFANFYSAMAYPGSPLYRMPP